MEINTRAQLTLALAGVLPAGYKIVSSPREFATLAPEIEAAIQVFRTSISPSPQNPMGAFAEEFELWVIEPKLADQDAVEDELDVKLAAVIETLDKLDWLLWTTAERSEHQSNRAAYKFTITVHSDITE